MISKANEPNIKGSVFDHFMNSGLEFELLSIPSNNSKIESNLNLKKDFKYNLNELLPVQIQLFRKISENGNVICSSGKQTGKTLGAITPFIHRLRASIPGQILYITNDTHKIRAINSKINRFLENRKDFFSTAITSVKSLTDVSSKGQILVTSGPILQKICFNSSKQLLSECFLNTRFVILDDFHQLQRKKQFFLLSLLNTIQPQQIVILSEYIQNLSIFSEIITEINGKTTVNLDLNSKKNIRQFFVVRNDFSYKKRLQFVFNLFRDSKTIVIFTENKRISNKIYKDISKLVLDRFTEDIDVDRKYLINYFNHHHILVNFDFKYIKTNQDKFFIDTKFKGRIFITSQPLSRMNIVTEEIFFLFDGLPRDYNKFTNFMNSFNNINEKGVESIYFKPNSKYDRLITTNKEFIKIFTSPHDYSLVNGKKRDIYHLSKLFLNVVFKITISESQETLLSSLNLIKKLDEQDKCELTELGKYFFKNFLQFTEEKIYLQFLSRKKNPIRTKNISRNEYQLRYLKHTIHKENGIIQEIVGHKKGKSGNSIPILRSLESKKELVNLFNRAELRTFIDYEVQYSDQYLECNNLALLNITPKGIYSSYIDKRKKPQELRYKYKPIDRPKPVITFGQIVVIEYYEQQINMVMAVHCLFHALRIHCGIFFKNIIYFTRKKKIHTGKEINELLLIDLNLTGIFNSGITPEILSTSEKFYYHHLNLSGLFDSLDHLDKYTLLLPPLPTYRYHKKKTEIIEHKLVLDCFTVFKKHLITNSNQI